VVQFFLGLLTECSAIGHAIKRISVLAVYLGVVVTIGELEPTLYGAANELSAAHPGHTDRCEEATENEQGARSRSAIDSGEHLGLRLPHAKEKVSRRQCRRHVSENSCDTVDSDRLFPSCLVFIHDLLMGFSHVFSDEAFGMG